MPEEPWEDPIVAEVHRVRREILAKFNDDLGAYFEDLYKRQELARQQGRTFITKPLRTEDSADSAA